MSTSTKTPRRASSLHELSRLAPDAQEQAVLAEVLRQMRQMQKRGDTVRLRRGKGGTRHLTRHSEHAHRHFGSSG